MESKKVKRGCQLELSLPTWGGAREGAGRKRQRERPSVPHVVRPIVRGWSPVLITLRVRADVPDLRQRDAWAAIVRVLRNFRGRFTLRFVHYSVLFNHIHFIAESPDEVSLSLGMQSLCTALGKRLNACFGRSGPVFDGRYHARELTTPLEVKNALRYVLLNARHHELDAGRTLAREWIDPRSTGAIFDGWRDPPTLREGTKDYGTSPARTWLLRTGWKKHGLLELDEVPGALRKRAA
jgi:putative transposase